MVDEFVGRAQDDVGGTIVLVKDDGLKVRILILEIEHDVLVSATPGIDGLVWVTDDIDAGIRF